MAQLKCPDCEGDLEQGTLVDQHINGNMHPQLFATFSQNKFTNLRRTSALSCKDCNRLFIYVDKDIISSDPVKSTTILFLIAFGSILLLILGIAVFAFLYT